MQPGEERIAKALLDEYKQCVFNAGISSGRGASKRMREDLRKAEEIRTRLERFLGLVMAGPAGSGE